MRKTCDNCRHENMSGVEYPCNSCVDGDNGAPTQWEGLSTSTFDTQVGGDYYTKLKIQPLEYSMANKLDPCQHTIIKYVTRFRDKNGLQDLEKAKDVLDKLIELYKKELANG